MRSLRLWLCRLLCPKGYRVARVKRRSLPSPNVVTKRGVGFFHSDEVSWGEWKEKRR